MSSMLSSMVVADLDGTLLHDANAFEQRYLSPRTLQLADQLALRSDVSLAIITARPVASALPLIHALHANVCAYLNGALIDFDCEHTTLQDLTSQQPNEQIVRFGFSSRRASDVCLQLLAKIPTLRIGIVMNDVRYTNFDVRILWSNQAYTISNFHDIPEGIADKIIVVPREHEKAALRALIPEDFSLHISEDVLWMLTNPLANKGNALEVIAKRLGIDAKKSVVFGDDIIDIDMFHAGGYGVAVANSTASLLQIADEVCESNNDDGVAKWIASHILR